MVLQVLPRDAEPFADRKVAILSGVLIERLLASGLQLWHL